MIQPPRKVFVATPLAWLLSLVLAVSARANEFRVSVSAGGHDRHFVPLSVDLESGRENLAAIAVRGSQVEPAQLEDLGSGKVRVWWILPELAAGQSMKYTIRLVPKGPVAQLFSWKDTSSAHAASLDLLLGKRAVLRYMYTPFDPQDVEKTKKPFHHVFSPDGSRLITKGLGGLYPHHRGIYFGYNRCGVGGKTYDTWHAKEGEHQIHVKVLRTGTGPVFGSHVVSIHWNDRQGKPFIGETRELIAFRQPEGEHLIEFRSTLQTTGRPVSLGGDRQHAGVQFRAAQYVAENSSETRYLRPANWKHLPADKQFNGKDHKDLPWNAIQFKVEDQTCTVAYLSDPENPDGAGFSERLYGRFGEFFPWQLRKDHPLSVRYRWWIKTGKVTREQIQERYEALARPPVVRLER